MQKMKLADDSVYAEHKFGKYSVCEKIKRYFGRGLEEGKGCIGNSLKRGTKCIRKHIKQLLLYI